MFLTLISNRTQIFSVSGPETRYSNRSTSLGSGSCGCLVVRRLDRYDQVQSLMRRSTPKHLFNEGS